MIKKATNVIHKLHLVHKRNKCNLKKSERIIDHKMSLKVIRYLILKKNIN